MSRKDEEIYETRVIVFRRTHGKCETCGDSIFFDSFQMAHIIPQRKHWLKRYGAGIIHNPENFKGTCPTDLCNGAASLGNNQHLCDLKAEEIRQAMEAEDDTE